MPGHRAWPMVEPDARDVVPADAPGVLYDTGLGYPAACFADDPASVVHGVVVGLDAAAAPELLRRLDRYEGAAYRRVRVVLSDGEPAEAYDWIGPRAELRVVVDGRWPKPGAVPADQ